MKFLRGVKGYSLLDHIPNEDIRKELKLKETVKEKLQKYKVGWLTHIERMDSKRIPSLCLHYRPIGRRCLGRPRKRWIEEAGTG